MIEQTKSVDELTPSDFAQSPVWEFLNDDESGEFLVQSVSPTPVENLEAGLVGTKVRLHNGQI
jgi:hypothetical protein